MFTAASAAIMSCGASGGTDTPTPPVPGGGDPTTPTPSVATTVILNRQTLTLTSVGETQQLSGEVRDQRGQTMPAAVINWASSNPAVATVSSSGLVSSVSMGTTNVIATSGNASASANVSVSHTVASLTITPDKVSLTGIGATQALTAAAFDATGIAIPNSQVTWTIAPTSVATISSNGLVTAVSAGNAVATATVQNTARTAAVTVLTPGSPQSCTTRPVLNDYLIDPSLIKVVTQIGVVGGGNTSIVGRSYVFAVDGDNVRLPLTAPTDLRIAAARHYAPPDSPAQGYVPDWSLLLDIGCGIKFELYHVKDVSNAIKSVVDTTVYPSSAWQPLAQPISIRSGEVFAWYIRGLNSVAFDVVAHDDTRRNQFANQPRYLTSNLLDIVCPWTLFAPAKRDAYLALIGSPGGQRVPGSGCGTVERDIPGTPSGQWFLSTNVADSWLLSKSGNYGNPLPIALGVDSTVHIGHIGPSSDLRIYRENATWKNPADITTSWCYQARNGSFDAGWLWLRMNSTTQMDVAYESTGSCPATFPASGFMPYYR